MVDMQTLAARIDRLERSVRRYRIASLAVVALTLGGIVAGFSNGIPDVIRARKFEVVDRRGNTRAELTSDGELMLWDSTDASGGRLSAVLSSNGGGGLALQYGGDLLVHLFATKRDGGGSGGMLLLSTEGGGYKVLERIPRPTNPH